MLTVQVNNSRTANSNSGYKGVIKTRNGRKWEAFLKIRQERKDKKIYIGVYDTIEEAVQARKDFIISLL